MTPYYVTFIISVLLCLFAERSLKNSNGKYDEYRKERNKGFIFCGKNTIVIPRFVKMKKIKRYHIFALFSVLAVTVLAGMRGYTVGTDVLTYGNSLFYYAKQYKPLPVYFERFSHIEPLYLVLVYVSSMLSEEPHILYYLTGLIIYGFLMAAFLKKSDTFPLALTWFAFLCLLYGDTYNAMRQCIAIAIGLWAFDYATKGKYVEFGAGILLAFLFHNTSVIFVLIYLVYNILQKNNSIAMKSIIIMSVICSILFFNQILALLMRVGILDLKMERYYISGSTGISVFAILIRIPFLVLILLEKKKFIYGRNESCKALKNENEADFYIISLLLELITVELSAFVASLYRISLYFLPFRCMAYARICCVQKRNNKYALMVLLIIYLVVIFIYQNQVKGNNEIYPYVFSF